MYDRMLAICSRCGCLYVSLPVRGTNSVSFTDCLGAGRTLAANRVASDGATLYRSGGWPPAICFAFAAKVLSNPAGIVGAILAKVAVLRNLHRLILSLLSSFIVFLFFNFLFQYTSYSFQSVGK